MDSIILETGDITLSPRDFTVTRGNQEVILTRTEYELLKYLMENEGRIVPKSELLEVVWQNRGKSTTKENTVEVYIRYLRCKLGAPNQIETRRGFGYRIVGRETGHEATTD